jgi:hypothetical protein
MVALWKRLAKRLAVGVKAFFGILTAVLGSPWWLIGWYCTSRDSPKGSFQHCFSLSILGLSYPLNACFVFVGLHGHNDLSELLSWEWGYSGWTIGMWALITIDMTYLRSEVFAGRDGEKAEQRFCALLLRPFGITGVEHAGDSYQWSFPLVALLMAQIFFFGAEWLNTVNPVLLCNVPAAINTTSDEIICPSYTIYSVGAKQCCVVDDRTFIPTSLLGQVGGNILAGYGLVKYIAWFILWGTDDVAKESDVETKRNDQQDEEIMLIVRCMKESADFDGFKVRLLAEERGLVTRRTESQLAKLKASYVLGYTKEDVAVDKEGVTASSSYFTPNSQLNEPFLQAFKDDEGGGMRGTDEGAGVEGGLGGQEEAMCEEGDSVSTSSDAQEGVCMEDGRQQEADAPANPGAAAAGEEQQRVDGGGGIAAAECLP